MSTESGVFYDNLGNAHQTQAEAHQATYGLKETPNSSSPSSSVTHYEPSGGSRPASIDYVAVQRNQENARKRQIYVAELSKNFTSYLEHAKNGDPSAQFNVGECYWYGAGVRKDIKTAYYWYSKAEEKGNQNAKNAISKSGGVKQKHTFPDGDVYEGYFFEGKMHGVGKMTYKNGNVYEVYEGDWFDGEQHGKGKYTWANGDVYEGDFVEGEHHGKGKMTWADGDVYEGDFVDGKCTGKGKLTWADGDVYEGDWADGKRTGKGKSTYADGSGTYEGDYVDGEKHGKGKSIWPDGRVYVGDYAHDSRTGKGKMTYSNGKVEEGRWEDGDFVGK